jgi:hypothetical protein
MNHAVVCIVLGVGETLIATTGYFQVYPKVAFPTQSKTFVFLFMFT